jgi:hypothetical protein
MDNSRPKLSINDLLSVIRIFHTASRFVDGDEDGDGNFNPPLLSKQYCLKDAIQNQFFKNNITGSKNCILFYFLINKCCRAKRLANIGCFLIFNPSISQALPITLNEERYRQPS